MYWTRSVPRATRRPDQRHLHRPPYFPDRKHPHRQQSDSAHSPLPKPRAGRRVSTSTTNPGRVFTSVSASAPASTAVRARRDMSLSVGESFLPLAAVLLRHAPDHQAAKRPTVCAEFHSARFHIRAADVELEGRDSRRAIQLADYFGKNPPPCHRRRSRSPAHGGVWPPATEAPGRGPSRRRDWPARRRLIIPLEVRNAGCGRALSRATGLLLWSQCRRACRDPSRRPSPAEGGGPRRQQQGILEFQRHEGYGERPAAAVTLSFLRRRGLRSG